MQYKDKLYGYLFVLVIVSIIAGAIYFLTKSSPIEGSNLLETSSIINRLEIAYNGSSLILEKNGSWSINGMPANGSLVSELISKLEKAQIIEIASTNIDNFSLFDINNNSPVLKVIFENQEKLELKIGKKSFDKSYVQKNNDSKVYFINVSITDYGVWSLESFLERKPFNFSKTEIAEVKINNESVNLDDNAITQLINFSSTNVFLNSEMPETTSNVDVSIKVAQETFSYKIITENSKFFVLNVNLNIVYEVTETIYRLFVP